jgi:hypothetical protein
MKCPNPICNKEMVTVYGLQVQIIYWYCKPCDEFYLEDEFHGLQKVDPRVDESDGHWEVTRVK